MLYFYCLRLVALREAERERERERETVACTFLLLGLLLEFTAVVEFDKQEGLEFGLMSIQALQLSDLQIVLRDVLLLTVLHGSHPSHGFHPVWRWQMGLGPRGLHARPVATSLFEVLCNFFLAVGTKLRTLPEL